jgi:hypothetical protein
MNTIEKFSKDSYLVERNLIGEELAKTLETQFKMHRDIMLYHTNNDESQFYDALVVDNTFCWYGPVDQLLVSLQPKIEKITGLQLEPTYSFGRIYYPDAVMKEHIDRPACEISVTLSISVDGAPWPIWVRNKQGIDIPLELFPGDAMIYKGQEIPHWRNPYTEGTEQVQFFLHWIIKDGNNTAWKYDKRVMLGLPGIDHKDTN